MVVSSRRYESVGTGGGTTDDGASCSSCGAPFWDISSYANSRGRQKILAPAHIHIKCTALQRLLLIIIRFAVSLSPTACHHSAGGLLRNTLIAIRLDHVWTRWLWEQWVWKWWRRWRILWTPSRSQFVCRQVCRRGRTVAAADHRCEETYAETCHPRRFGVRCCLDQCACAIIATY